MRRIIHHQVTGSTNDDARFIALDGAAHGTVVMADAQTHGRGRRGAVWISPPGVNLICSVILRPTLPPEQWPRLTHACALAVCDAIDAIHHVPRALIKWPNDIFISSKKVCGILVESVFPAPSRGFVIVGVGVNVNSRPEDFPPELRSDVTSLWLERGGQQVALDRFAMHFFEALDQWCTLAVESFDAILAACEARSFLSGKSVIITRGDTHIDGVACGLGPNGELLVTIEGMIHCIASVDRIRLLSDET